MCIADNILKVIWNTMREAVRLEGPAKVARLAGVRHQIFNNVKNAHWNPTFDTALKVYPVAKKIVAEHDEVSNASKVKPGRQFPPIPPRQVRP